MIMEVNDYWVWWNIQVVLCLSSFPLEALYHLFVSRRRRTPWYHLVCQLFSRLGLLPGLVPLPSFGLTQIASTLNKSYVCDSLPQVQLPSLPLGHCHSNHDSFSLSADPWCPNEYMRRLIDENLCILCSVYLICHQRSNVKILSSIWNFIWME